MVEALGTARESHTATLLSNGKVLVAGGEVSSLTVLASVELYDPATNTWSIARSLVGARRAHTGTLLANGKVLVAGGYRGGYLSSAELYDPGTDTWATAGPLTTARSGHTATLLANGQVLVVGGQGSSGILASAELYDPGSDVWTAVGALATARYGHTATLLPNGKVLAAGGSNGSTSLAGAELYSPATTAWAATGALATARDHHTATLLPNGKVLAAGGANGSTSLASAELYSPASATWAETGALAARDSHTATLLTHGKVLVAGGYGNGSYLGSAQLYDPATATWTSTGALATAARSAHTATLLTNGRVLFAGGYRGGGVSLNSADLFDAGLVPDPWRQPTLGSVTPGLLPGTPLIASGSAFHPNWEASGGGTNSSATNFPLLQIMRLDNGQTRWLPVDPAIPFSDTTTTSTAAALSGFPAGPLRVTVFVNGIPSAALLTTYSISLPDAPTIGTATAGDRSASVAFSAPANDGGAAIDSYRATCTGGISSTGETSPINVSPLTNGDVYACTVAAHNPAGWGGESAAANEVTPVVGSNANLANLTLSVGTLSPAFAGSTLSYTAGVANGSSAITVTPTVADAAAPVKVNGVTVASGSASGSISLNVGDNIITVLVTAQDGTTTRSYTITVTRSPSTNANLGALTLSSGTLSPTFASGTATYTASVANSVAAMTATPTVTDATATVKVNGVAVASGSASASISLSLGANIVTVLVTAQDGTTTKSYTITVTRAMSSNASLSSLTLSSGSLSPAFAGGTLSYTAAVANGVASMTVTPTVADATATVKVNDVTVASGSASAPISLNLGANIVTVLVTAQDGTTTRSYTITVNRAMSSNADLSTLIVSSGALAPAFASSTLNYTAAVPNSVSSLMVTPTVTDATATVKVNGTTVASGSASGTLSLNAGANIITVLVTAQNGTTTKSYTITVTRTASSNADLNALTASSGTLSPAFATTTFSYAVAVANSVSAITITATAADATATVKVNGTTVPSGSASGAISLSAGSNAIPVVVTAQNGITTNTYTIIVSRAPSSNADLVDLVPSSGTLTPAFASGTVSYTAAVALSVSSLTVTPMVADSAAKVKVNGVTVGSGSASGSISLNPGANIITALVTAQDGTTTRSYMITVNRAMSNNADLSAMTASGGVLTPAFSSGTTTYSSNVVSNFNTITVTPTLVDAAASIKVNDVTVANGSASGSIALSPGSNSVAISVTAQDAVATKTYTIDVNYVLASSCTYSLSPNDLPNRLAVGGSASIAVATPDGCPVTATSLQPWVSVNSITSDGSATTVSLQIGANAGPARATPITVAGRLFLVTQGAGP